MQRSFHASMLLLLLAGCGSGNTPTAPPPGNSSQPPTQAAVAAGATVPAPTSAQPTPAAAPATTLAGRTEELSNPDNSAVVFLYYDLAGIAPPLDTFVEKDSRVTGASPPDRAGQREVVRAELQAAAAAVHNIGKLRLSLDADLSTYDPSYQEFSVRALAPSSVINFDALGQNISVKFSNGKTAQIWRVAPAEAQVIKDKLGPYGRASLDVLLEIVGVQPAPAGGTINTRIAEYELREKGSGTVLGRIQVAQ